MSTSSSPSGRDPNPLLRYGRIAWALLGILAVVVVMARALGAISGIVVPLVIAVILGTVLSPIVTALERRGVSPALASVAGLLTAVIAVVGIVVIIVRGFVQELPKMTRQLGEGWTQFAAWARSLDLDAVWLERVREAVQESVPKLGQGVLGAVQSTFTGAATFAIGAFFALFLLFFVLRDGRKFAGWAARVMKQDEHLLHIIEGLAHDSIRAYFRGTAVTAIITAPVFILPLVVLKVPLVVPIFIMYFFTSFIPYIGAWITGVFAVLIAFSSGGPTAALVVTLGLLISNGTLQSVVSSWALGASLRLHPVSVLMVTIIGGTLAGILGMILAPPLLAAMQRSWAAIREYRAEPLI